MAVIVDAIMTILYTALDVLPIVLRERIPLGDEDDELFVIGDCGQPYIAPRDAELYLFANDMPSKYGNNKGSLEVTITRKA